MSLNTNIIFEVLDVKKSKLMRNFLITLFSRNTILALGSFLDTFQKIADAATNTKGKNYMFYIKRLFIAPSPHSLPFSDILILNFKPC